MKQYLTNLWLFLCGFRWLFTREVTLTVVLDESNGVAELRDHYAYRDLSPAEDPTKRIHYRDGWTPWKYLLRVYWWDVGLCVICLGGAVEPISTFAQRHRTGTVWDKLLDVIEHWDPGHGATSGPALWGSVECGRVARTVAPSLTLVALIWLMFA